MYEIRPVFSINIKKLTANLIYQNFFFVKLFLADRAVALDNFNHCLVVIPPHFLIRHPAVPLSCSNVGVAQKVLHEVGMYALL